MDRPYTAAEIEALTYTLLGEARGEGALGMAAVAHVIRNRAESGIYPADPVAVALQPGQFTTNNPVGGNQAATRREVPVGSRLYNIAAGLVASIITPATRAMPDITGGAVNYHTVSTSPRWASGATTRWGTVEIGEHLFYARQPVPPINIPEVASALDVAAADVVAPQPMPRLNRTPSTTAIRTELRAETRLQQAQQRAAAAEITRLAREQLRADEDAYLADRLAQADEEFADEDAARARAMDELRVLLSQPKPVPFDPFQPFDETGDAVRWMRAPAAAAAAPGSGLTSAQMQAMREVPVPARTAAPGAGLTAAQLQAMREVPAPPAARAPIPADRLVRAPVPADPIQRAPIPADPIQRAPVPADRIVRAPVPADPIQRAPIPADRIQRAPVPADRIQRDAPAPVPAARIEIVDLTKGGTVNGKAVPANPLAGKRRTEEITGIVFHHTGGSGLLGAMTAGQAKGVQKGTGAQYYIDRDGAVYRYASDADVISHIRSPGNRFRTDKGLPTNVLSNANTIGIEIVAPNSSEMTPQQIASATALAALLSELYKIGPDFVVGHGQLQGGKGGNKMSDEGVQVAAAYRAAPTATPAPRLPTEEQMRAIREVPVAVPPATSAPLARDEAQIRAIRDVSGLAAKAPMPAPAAQRPTPATAPRQSPIPISFEPMSDRSGAAMAEGLGAPIVTPSGRIYGDPSLSNGIAVGTIRTGTNGYDYEWNRTDTGQWGWVAPRGPLSGDEPQAPRIVPPPQQGMPAPMPAAPGAGLTPAQMAALDAYEQRGVPARAERPLVVVDPATGAPALIKAPVMTSPPGAGLTPEQRDVMTRVARPATSAPGAGLTPLQRVALARIAPPARPTPPAAFGVVPDQIAERIVEPIRTGASPAPAATPIPAGRIIKPTVALPQTAKTSAPAASKTQRPAPVTLQVTKTPPPRSISARPPAGQAPYIEKNVSVQVGTKKRTITAPPGMQFSPTGALIPIAAQAAFSGWDQYAYKPVTTRVIEEPLYETRSVRVRNPDYVRPTPMAPRPAPPPPATIRGSSTGASYVVGQVYQAGGYAYRATSAGFEKIGSARPAGVSAAQDYAQRAAASVDPVLARIDRDENREGGFDGMGGGGSLVG